MIKRPVTGAEIRSARNRAMDPVQRALHGGVKRLAEGETGGNRR